MPSVDVTSAQQDSFIRYINSAIELALWPWKPGEISYFLTNFSEADSMVVETELLPRLPCAFSPSDRDLVAAHCKDEIVMNMADTVFHWFRYRPTYPVDDHIILGED